VLLIIQVGLEVAIPGVSKFSLLTRQVYLLLLRVASVQDQGITGFLHGFRRCQLAYFFSSLIAQQSVANADFNFYQFMVVQGIIEFLRDIFSYAFLSDPDYRFQIMGQGP